MNFASAPRRRLYQAPVTSVHAVLGPPEQRCWVERQEVVEREEPNVKGAIIGGILGGILGHHVGGSHEGAATAGGAIAGAAIGSQVGRDSDVYSRDVQRCRTVPSGPPEFWEVTYNFHGYDHVIQMNSPPPAPGSTITVNRDGEPRRQ